MTNDTTHDIVQVARKRIRHKPGKAVQMKEKVKAEGGSGAGNGNGGNSIRMTGIAGRLKRKSKKAEALAATSSSPDLIVTQDAITKGISSGDSQPNSDEGRSSADSQAVYNTITTNSSKLDNQQQHISHSHLQQQDTLKVDDSSLREIIEQDSNESSIGVNPYCGTSGTTTTNTTSTNQSQRYESSRSVGASGGGVHHRTRESLDAKRERKAAKTLAIITGVFVLCWLPFFIIALLMPICGEYWSICAPPKIVFSTFLWLGYVNSMLNPIIYTIFSPDFRSAFKRILLGKKTPTRSPCRV